MKKNNGEIKDCIIDLKEYDFNEKRIHSAILHLWEEKNNQHKMDRISIMQMLMEAVKLWLSS